MVTVQHPERADIHWGRRTYERILVGANKNQSKTKLEHKNNIYKLRNFWWPTGFRQGKNANATQENSTLAHNLFLKKSRVLSDIMGSHHQSQSFTVVIVIASIFLFLTMTITAAVIVFCRKRNTVFALQKSDEDADYDFELDELTDLEYTDTEFESEADSCSIMKNSYTKNSDHENSECNCSPAKQPLVNENAKTEMVEVHYNPNYLSAHYIANCASNVDQRGAYQKIAMTTILDKQGMTRSLLSTASDSEDSLCEQRLYKMCGSKKNYYGIAGLVNADVDSDSDTGGILKKTFRNFQGRMVCGGDTINYESMTSLSSGHDCVLSTAASGQDECSAACSSNPLLPRAGITPAQPGVTNDTSLKSPDVAVDLGEGHTDSLLAFMKKKRKLFKTIVDSNTHSAKSRRKDKTHNVHSCIPRTKSDSHIVSSNAAYVQSKHI